MGAGKTTLASALADRLGRPLCDSDADITDNTGMEADTIAAQPGGKRRLHDLEAAHLTAALSSDNCVIAAAASVVDRAELRAAMAPATVIWLDAPPEVLAQRFVSEPHRPVYGDPHEVLAAHDERRRPHLSAVADIVLDATQPPAAVLSEALAALDARGTTVG